MIEEKECCCRNLVRDRVVTTAPAATATQNAPPSNERSDPGSQGKRGWSLGRETDRDSKPDSPPLSHIALIGPLCSLFACSRKDRLKDQRNPLSAFPETCGHRCPLRTLRLGSRRSTFFLTRSLAHSPIILIIDSVK